MNAPGRLLADRGDVGLPAEPPDRLPGSELRHEVDAARYAVAVRILRIGQRLERRLRHRFE